MTWTFARRPMTRLATVRGVAIVYVTHLTKAYGGKAIYRAMGSLAFTAAARAVWLVMSDKEDAARRMFLNVGMNLAADPGGLGYGIRTDTDGRPFIAWEAGRLNVSADAAMAAELKDDDRKGALTDAIAFVREQSAGWAGVVAAARRRRCRGRDRTVRAEAGEDTLGWPRMAGA